jgi:hypothetical protein
MDRDSLLLNSLSSIIDMIEVICVERVEGWDSGMVNLVKVIDLQQPQSCSVSE